MAIYSEILPILNDISLTFNIYDYFNLYLNLDSDFYRVIGFYFMCVGVLPACMSANDAMPG